jgi:transcription antitermination factor NusG
MAKKKINIKNIFHIILTSITITIITILNSFYFQYMIDIRNGQKIIVPDDQMRQFIAVAGTYDEHLIFFSPDEVNLRKGTKVRITGGDFEGYEGVFVKVKGERDRRVVISLQGVIAMAMATISPDLIEVIEEPKKK